ncbi:MAG TPA: hypothetical protein VGM54_25560 [Chthoniobacter sp.]|jgi:hypothetical protein
MSPRSPLPVLSILAAGFFGVTGLHAQQPQQDAQPIDVNRMLKELTTLAPKTQAQASATKLATAKTILGQANSGDGGVTYWESAIEGTQMDGAGHDSNNFRIWKETEGDVYKDKEVQSAVHLHLEWLALTLQRSSGASVKEMLPTILNYAQELWADQVLMTMLAESVKKEKETAAPQVPGGRGARNSPAGKALGDDRKIREVHDQILNKNLANSLITNWLHLREYVAQADGWEDVPGNLDGIYKNIIQPELRAEKDPRVFQYWDTKMKIESETASRTKLNFEIEKYNNQTAPALLFGRAQEYVPLGQKNRAATEMYAIIQKYPTHPQASEWINTLQTLLAPPPAPDATAGTPAAPVPAPAAAATLPAAIAPAPAPVAPAPAAVAPAPAARAAAPSPGVSASTLALPGALPGQ